LIFADWFAAARSEIELNAGQTEQALRLAEAAVEEAQATGGIFSEGIAQRVWGQALATVNGSGDAQAEVHLEKSLKLLEEGEAVIEVARTHVALGQVLRARGNMETAREHFEKAAAQFQASGLAGELEQTKHLIDSVSV
jgi:tetratricopeptide (TPR) repeat protein